MPQAFLIKVYSRNPNNCDDLCYYLALIFKNKNTMQISHQALVSAVLVSAVLLTGCGGGGSSTSQTSTPSDSGNSSSTTAASSTEVTCNGSCITLNADPDTSVDDADT
jgi:hypothetical protein